MSEADDFTKEYLAFHDRRHLAVREAIPVICAALERHAITQVDVEYDGYGDDGQIEHITMLRGKQALEDANRPCDQVTVMLAGWQGRDAATLPVSEAIEAIVGLALPGGWENNSGAYGTATLDVPGRRLLIEHEWRLEETDHQEFTFDAPA